MTTESSEPIYGYEKSHIGLTKREYFANSALQGLLSIFDSEQSIVPNDNNIKYMVQLAVNAADKLIEELNKKK